MSVRLFIAGRRVTAARPAEADWAPGTNLHQLAVEAQAIVDDVRQHDPLTVRQVLAIGCATEPTRMAQLLMVLAAWVPDNETLSMRAARVEAITAPRGPRGVA